MYQFTCKRCRRLGYRVCDSAKCPLTRKPYPPGQGGKRALRRRLSEFGSQLAEKQKLKFIYGLRERQFKRYFDLAARKRGNTPQVMVELLERRLDNVIFRSGWAPSRSAARQLVGHGHISVNGKRVKSPSYLLKIGDVVGVRTASQTKGVFADTRTILKKFQPPVWLELDKEKLSSTLKAYPDQDFLAGLAVEVPKVLEYYSR